MHERKKIKLLAGDRYSLPEFNPFEFLNFSIWKVVLKVISSSFGQTFGGEFKPISSF